MGAEQPQTGAEQQTGSIPRPGAEPKQSPTKDGPNFVFRRERKPRPEPQVPSDATPSHLASEYAQGLSALRLQTIGASICAAALLILSLLDTGRFSFLSGLMPSNLMLPIGLGIFAVCTLLCVDVLKDGLIQLATRAPNADTLALFATVFTFADGISLLVSHLRTDTFPFFAPCGLVLTLHMVGKLCARSASLRTAETAASIQYPYVVTQDENLLSGKPAFRKSIASPQGFGRQMRTETEGELRFRRLTPVLLVACICLPLITTVAHHQPKLVFWSYSALFSAAATLGAPLSFAMPFSALTKKLARLGIALAGWPGVVAAQGCKGVMITDYDLYPPGTVTLSGGQTFTLTTPLERVISLSASLVRASGSGLVYAFDRTLQKEGGAYLPVQKLTMQENGLVGECGGQKIMLGNSEFMLRMGIVIPEGIRVKDAVLCTVDGQLVGMFTMRYSVHPTVLPSIFALLEHKFQPILATRDFNLNAHRLRMGGRFPVDQVIFPSLNNRVQFSGANQVHSNKIVALLCREGFSPFCGALIAGKRIYKAARWNSLFVNISACVGVVLTTSLSSAGALGAMSAWNLSLYLLLWLAPVLLLSLWTTQSY